MTNLIEALQQLILRITTAPNNVKFIIDETVQTAGKEFEIYKGLGHIVPNYIEIYSSQNFNLRVSMNKTSPVAADQLPRTYAANIMWFWKNEGWTNVKIIPTVAAAIDGYASGRDHRVKLKFKKGGGD